MTNQFTKDERQWITKLATRGLNCDQVAMMLSISNTEELAEAVQHAQAKGVQALPKSAQPGHYDNALKGRELERYQAIQMLEPKETTALTKYLIERKRREIDDRD